MCKTSPMLRWRRSKEILIIWIKNSQQFGSKSLEFLIIIYYWIWKIVHQKSVSFGVWGLSDRYVDRLIKKTWLWNTFAVFFAENLHAKSINVKSSHIDRYLESAEVTDDTLNQFKSNLNCVTKWIIFCDLLVDELVWWLIEL